jgi:hypothetical protein
MLSKTDTYDNVAEYFRSVYGFTYSSDENIPLVWPTNSVSKRLTVLLHFIVRLCQDGMNVPVVADDMLRRGGVFEEGKPRVLDLMTNSAAWCVSNLYLDAMAKGRYLRVTEMASIYPNANFTTIDTKPLVPHKPHPRINFEVYDFYAGIMEPDASFDIVHIRQGVLAVNIFIIRDHYHIKAFTISIVDQGF